jgi:hypothetical protein
MLKGLALYTTYEKDHHFVEAATWADEIKNQGLDTQSHWHFVDNPYFDNGFEKKDWAPEPYNVTWAIVSIRKHSQL